MSSSCQKCPLHVGATNVCVGGRGKAQAPFLVVLDRPSVEEDVAGRMGSGRYYALMVEMLKEAGYSGEDARLTFAVRCCPPKRAPETEEINACKEYLISEVRTGNYRAIIAVGDVSFRALCNAGGIQSKRGTSFGLVAGFDSPELEVWPIYSPSMVFKTPNYRGVIVEDLRRIRNSFLEPEKIIYTEAAVLGDVVAWDVETDWNYETKTGGDNVIQSAYSFRDVGGVVHTCVTTSPPFQSPIPLLGERTLVTHNGWGFDLPRLGLPAFGRDTMALAWLDDETQPKSLDALASKYCGAVSWKSGKTALPGSEEFKEYNARDAYYTLLLHEELCKRLGPRVKIADLIILPAFNALKACSERGIYISQAKVAQFMGQFTTEERDSLATLQEYVGDIAPWCRNSKGVLAYTKPTKFNPGSPHQISEWFRYKGIMTTPTATGNAMSSSAKALEQAVMPQEFREPLETYRHAKKMIGTYLEPLVGVERLHPEYHLYPRVIGTGGTTSGRLTASHNVLTLPREMKRGGVYSAPPGKILAEADYGSLEFRLGAWFSGAKTILANYAADPEWDAHNWHARNMYKLEPDAEVPRELRQNAKPDNFSLWYCGYWKTSQNYAAGMGLKRTQAECEQSYAVWHAGIPEAQPWWVHTLGFVKEHGYIETPTGRRRNFGPWKNIPYDMRADVQREAVNMLNQSFGHDLTLLALANCHAEGLPINHEFHDAIYFELDEFTSEEQKLNFEALVRDCMITRPTRTLLEEFGCDLNVPLTIEISYKRLGD